MIISKEERQSALQLGEDYGLPFASGNIDQNVRQDLLGLYRGILIGFIPPELLSDGLIPRMVYSTEDQLPTMIKFVSY